MTSLISPGIATLTALTGSFPKTCARIADQAAGRRALACKRKYQKDGPSAKSADKYLV